MLRSQARWYEQGEKGTKYFLQLEKRNQVKKEIKKLQREDGSFTTDDQEIIDMQASFYENLYSGKNVKTKIEISDYLGSITSPKLTVDERDHCEGLLTVSECRAVLKTFKTNKSPGNDGISVEFYKKCWGLYGKLMTDAFNTAYVQGELSASQR